MKLHVSAKKENFSQGPMNIPFGYFTIAMSDIVWYVLRELVEWESKNGFIDFSWEKQKTKKAKERFAEFKQQFDDIDLVIEPTVPKMWVPHIMEHLRSVSKNDAESMKKKIPNFWELTDMIISRFFEVSESLSLAWQPPFQAMDVKRKQGNKGTKVDFTADEQKDAWSNPEWNLTTQTPLDTRIDADEAIEELNAVINNRTLEAMNSTASSNWNQFRNKI